MVLTLSDSLNTLDASSQIPVRPDSAVPLAITAGVGAAAVLPAAGAGVGATGAGVGAGAVPVKGTDTAMASMCALSAFALDDFESFSLTNCAMVSRRLLLASSMSSSPCSSDNLLLRSGLLPPEAAICRRTPSISD